MTPPSKRRRSPRKPIQQTATKIVYLTTPEMSRRTNIAEQTLINWRYLKRHPERDHDSEESKAARPEWVTFGSCVRYPVKVA